MVIFFYNNIVISSGRLIIYWLWFRFLIWLLFGSVAVFPDLNDQQKKDNCAKYGPNDDTCYSASGEPIAVPFTAWWLIWI